jgi:hypothetical protein
MNKLQKFFNDSWRFYTSYLVSLSIIVFIPTMPIDFVMLLDMTVVLVEFDTTWYFFSLHVILIPLYLSALIVFMASRVDGNSPSFKSVYTKAFQFWWPMAVVYLVTSILIGIGFLALIIPGLIVMARTSYAQFYCVLENNSPMEAIKKSWSETRENQWIILIGLTVMYLAIEVPDWLASKALSAIGVNYAFIHVVTSILYGILFSLPIIFAFRMYSDRKTILNKLNQQGPSAGTH